MSRIAIPGPGESPAESQTILDNINKTLGFLPNHSHVHQSERPWRLGGPDEAGVEDPRPEDAGGDGTRGLGGERLRLLPRRAQLCLDELAKIPSEEIALNRQGQSSDPKRQAAVAFAKALIETRGKVSDAQFAAVKDAGWTDANIVEMIALTAQFLLTNFMNNAVQTPIDFPEVTPAKTS